MPLPSIVRIVEVGPRDGLQSESIMLDTAVKLELIDRLGAAGLKSIEAGSFVSPKRVPQMAGSGEVLAQLQRRPGVSYSVLVPNLQGLEQALAAGATEVVVFAAASEAFSQKNINCSIAESMARFRPVIEVARQAKVRVRGSVSCAFACPYQGEVPPVAAAEVGKALMELGCYEICLCDTIGVATPRKTRLTIEAVARHVPLKKLAAHFHDTYGMAVANIYTAMEMGIAVIDTAVAGLGGCPFAAGASGNVATEDVVYLLQGLGIDTGIDLDLLVHTGAWISAQFGRQSGSKVARAILARSQQPC